MRTYGSLDWIAGLYSRGRWTIKAEPQVMVRLKRVFPRLELDETRQHQGEARLGDSLDISRDLEWFMERYPLEMSPRARKRLKESVGSWAKRQKVIDALIGAPASDLLAAAREFKLAVPPRDYQRVAADLTIRTGGLLLADDVGIGKTCTAICVATEPGQRPALVVTLTHLPIQWEREVRKFAPWLRTHIIRGREGAELYPYDLRLTRRTAKRRDVAVPLDVLPDVIITSYSKLALWAEVLAPLVRTVIYDEVQELRHKGTKKYTAAETVSERATTRLGLSATPIHNYGDEIHSVIDVLRPGDLGARDEFLREWCEREDNRGRACLKDPKAFGAYCRDQAIILRRTRAEVARELPPVSRVIHHVDCDREKLDDLTSAAGELARIILHATDHARGEDFRAAGEFDAMMRLATGVSKAPFVAEFVKLLLDQGEKVVLFGWHHAVYGIWRDRLKDFAPVFYTGTESVIQKRHAEDAFVRGDARLLVMSLRAGAGLDGLQKVSRTGVFGELDWSPGVHEQCEGRLARDEQKEPCVFYYPVADEGSDPVMMDVLGVKGRQIKGLRDPRRRPEDELIEKLTVDRDRIKELARRYLANHEAELAAAEGKARVLSLAERRVMKELELVGEPPTPPKPRPEDRF